MFLETWFHIISDLSNSVTDGVSDLGVGMADELHDSSNDWLDLLDLIDVLSDLGESHDGGENVSPVRVSQHFIDCGGHDWDDLGLSDGGDQSVDGIHSESGGLKIFIFFDVFIESFRGSLPDIFDFVLNLDHVDENHLNERADQCFLINNDFWDSFQEGDQSLTSHLLDSH